MRSAIIGLLKLDDGTRKAHYAQQIKKPNAYRYLALRYHSIDY